MRGGQWQVLHLLRGLGAAGQNCTLLARAGSPLLEHARRERFDARPLRLRELMRLAPAFDIVHAHDGRAHRAAAIMSLCKSPPLIVSRRVAFPIGESALSRWKYSRASHYIAVSNHVKQILTAAGIPAGDMTIVYDGVPLPAAPRFGARSRVVALDSTDPGKGKPLIEDASRRAKVDVCFSKNLAADLACAGLFVYISDSEGLGSAALLAMAAGVPVLASAVGGLPEIVEDGVTGILTGNSSEQIASGMLRMLQDPALLERLGRNARARVEETFTTDRMTRNTLRVYETVLA